MNDRTMIAAMAMQALLTHGERGADVSTSALVYADQLLDRLSPPKAPGPRDSESPESLPEKAAPRRKP